MRKRKRTSRSLRSRLKRLRICRAGFEDNHCAALACYLRSVDLANAKLPKPAEDTLAALLMDRGKARQFFEENFVPFQILAEPGLLTSYFQPVLKGSRTPSPAFPIPVYRRPADLTPLPLGHALTANGLTAARDAVGRFEPYFTRAEDGGVSGRARPRNPLSRRRDRSVHHARPGLGPHRTR